MNPTIFLDFDGCIRVSVQGGWVTSDTFDFSPEHMRRVRACCLHTGAKIVISSDWRGPNELDTILGHIGSYLGEFLHEDWMTPIKGWRWMEVAQWLRDHPEVTEYAILEDTKVHFENCPVEMADRIVWCNNRHGFVASLVPQLISKFTPNNP